MRTRFFAISLVSLAYACLFFGVHEVFGIFVGVTETFLLLGVHEVFGIFVGVTETFLIFGVVGVFGIFVGVAARVVVAIGVLYTKGSNMMSNRSVRMHTAMYSARAHSATMGRELCCPAAL